MSTPISTNSRTDSSPAEHTAAFKRLPAEPSSPVLDALLTPAMLAERLGMTERTLSEWRITGRGPAFIRIGKTVRYRPSVVDSWLLSQERRSTSEERR